MIYGYARVSTEEQNLDLQLEALEQKKCGKVFTDKVSGASTERTGFQKLTKAIKAGDTLVVWRLDRLSRSLSSIITLLDDYQTAGIHFVSVMEAINTNTPSGTLQFHIIAALAQYERAMISERTKAGMAAAKRKGVHIGRKPSMTALQVTQARKMIDEGEAVSVVAAIFGIHRTTLKRHLKK
jgi:DNA invertase Pin-like site-specific DNA recombinase